MTGVRLSPLQVAFLDLANAIKARALESAEQEFQARLRVLVDDLDVPEGVLGDFTRDATGTLFVTKESGDADHR